MRDPTLISVIDDDGALLEALTSLLRSAGYAVEAFASAEAFLAAGATRRSACIVTDIQMPGLSGIALKGRLDADQVAAPVIMITALPEPLLHERALAAGAFRLLKKPFASDDLLAALEDALAEGEAG